MRRGRDGTSVADGAGHAARVGVPGAATTVPADLPVAATAGDVAVIVVSHDDVDALTGCLDAYDAQDIDRRLEVIVVDNASTDGSAELLRERATQPRRRDLRVVISPRNRGYAGAINDAMALTDAGIVVFSNTDVVASPDLLSRAVAALEQDPLRGSVQPRLLREHARSASVDSTGHVLTSTRVVLNRGEGERSDDLDDAGGEVFGVSGALAIHRRAMLDDVAWRRQGRWAEVLSEELFAYHEDVELDWRARRLGWRAWYEPGAVAVHARRGATRRRTTRVECLNASNRVLVTVTCDDAVRFVGALPGVVAAHLLMWVALGLTRPLAAIGALARIVRRLPGAVTRRRRLDDRARVSAREVVDAWVEPFPWRRHFGVAASAWIARRG